MYQKPVRILFILMTSLALITACSRPALNDLNCRPDDVRTNPPFIHLSEDAVMAANIPFPDQLTGYSRVALAENQATGTDVLCTLRVYESVDLAGYALQLLCLQGTGDSTAEQLGDAACGFQNGDIKEIHFQQGDTVVTVREDSGGPHVSQWAQAVNGRLD